MAGAVLRALQSMQSFRSDFFSLSFSKTKEHKDWNLKKYRMKFIVWSQKQDAWLSSGWVL